MEEIRRRLAELGANDEEIDRALATTDLGIASDLRLLKRATMSARQLADAADTSLEDVVVSYLHLGVTIDDTDAVLFQPAEVDLVRLLAIAVDDLFTDEEGSDILRVAAAAFSQIADTAVNEFAIGVEDRVGGATPETDGDPHKVLDALVATAELGEAFSDVAGLVLIHHFRQAAERQRETMRAAEVRNLSRYAVGFVDVAGYTARSAALAPQELSDFVRRFEVAAFELAVESGARVVKHIGDEVMFVATTAAAACRFATALVRRFGDDDTDARGGVAFGDVLTRRGDFHGPVVNLASRLTDEAVDGEVLVDQGVHDAVGEALALEPAGRRKLKGFVEPVRAWSLTV